MCLASGLPLRLAPVCCSHSPSAASDRAHTPALLKEPQPSCPLPWPLDVVTHAAVALSTSRGWQLLGVVFASLQGGLGEASCLAMTSYYRRGQAAGRHGSCCVLTGGRARVPRRYTACGLYRSGACQLPCSMAICLCSGRPAITMWSSGTGFAGVAGYAWVAVLHIFGAGRCTGAAAVCTLPHGAHAAVRPGGEAARAASRAAPCTLFACHAARKAQAQLNQGRYCASASPTPPTPPPQPV